jgi:hypothetical protein
VYALSDVRAGSPLLQTQFLATYESEAEGWRGGLQPYGPMSLLPSSQALNYGQSIFEGMKVLSSDIWLQVPPALLEGINALFFSPALG